jgi:hypothetical protein
MFVHPASTNIAETPFANPIQPLTPVNIALLFYMGVGEGR